ncbi:hypothetical protein P4637_02040 [Halalkalibacterium halodurans]|uniref:SGNH/GDSL hydrolase family protein n=1 Tax=Halalkalibacterium halodurans TaxID=86665 RepID=UPI0006A9F5AC|nr:hypothetical protein [Halalkalibacterium halodurans]MED4081978.1 hypothetical protein [Halalkalibacterium halodurans]MED4083640.1 hypothetical protein [Halalkalibacterium halodurans]MED4106606.1 hypothetical protein [Halalkalibacterium halodurans]MED4107868.1 hypothetical protein [Halalkalibacterium halodurans]MED4123016.1 hypothetical protein [Halalkalibacterium halodurans]
MKNYLFLIGMLVCIVILSIGYVHYNAKLKTIANDAHEQIEASPLTSHGDRHSVNRKEDGNSTQQPEADGLIGQLLQEKDSITITAFGSTSLTSSVDSNDEAWPNVMIDQMNDQFGTGAVTLSIVDVGRTISTDVIQGDYANQVIDSNPDILLIEPFMLNDNGQVLPEDTLYVLEQLLIQFESDLPDTHVILLPANPIYGASYYLSQIEMLKAFANNHNFSYADHWEAWPSTEDGGLEDFLESGRPNKDGHQVWADFMVDYLTTNE